VGTHQPVRRLAQERPVSFACTDFRKAGTNDQFYDIDFWVNEHGGKRPWTRSACTRCR